MTTALGTLRCATERLRPTDLDRVLTVADLQTRIDRKYLIPVTTFAELINRLDSRLEVLQVGGRRIFDYESVYFDTPDLVAYLRHAHGRRRRFKVRTRTYLDSAETVLEVKTEGGRDETIKDRHPYRLTDRYQLTAPARLLIADKFGDAALASQLQVSLVNRYQRATLVDHATGSRITCDVSLTFAGRHQHRTGPENLVLIESKTNGAPAPVDTRLWRLGHRPTAISKYCVGLALLDPHLPANRWNRVLRRGFRWTPAQERQLAEGQCGV